LSRRLEEALRSEKEDRRGYIIINKYRQWICGLMTREARSRWFGVDSLFFRAKDLPLGGSSFAPTGCEQDSETEALASLLIWAR